MEYLTYGYYTIIYSSVIVPFAHQRDDVLSLDTAGTDVGQYTLHPIARLEADLTLVHDDQQQEPVIAGLRAQAP